jgi:TRAP-type C4-dicarboxylate transport system substrate-binding protein
MRSNIALAAGTAALIAMTGPAASKDFNASIWFPETHPLTEYGYLEWAEAVRNADADLNPNVFVGTVLLPPAGHLSGIRDGIAQVGYHAGTYTPGELPVDNLIAQLAFNYSDYYVAAFAITEFNMTDPAALQQWKDNGIVYGGGYATPPYRLFCTSEVKTLEDIKGKKLRMPGAAHSDWAKSVGAVPVNVASSEMYNGLDKGQLDCASNAANDLKSRSLWDVAKHTTLVELGVYWAGYEYGYDADFWAGLSEKQRRVLFDTMAEAIVKTGQGYVGAAQEALDEAPDHDVEVIEPSDELKASIDEFAKTARANAIEMGKSKFGLDDPEAIIERFSKIAEKWETKLADVSFDDTETLTEMLKTEVYDKIDAASYGKN